MENKRYRIHSVIVFVIAQIAWLTLVVLWVYLYLSNYIIVKRALSGLSIKILAGRINILVLIGGFFLLLMILGGMYFIFIFLAKQVDTTRAYDNFIANVTHELKSPLASIQLHLETLKKRNVERTKQRELIDLMLKDTDRLRGLIETILKISMIEQKKMIYNFDVYEIGETIIPVINEVVSCVKLDRGRVKIEGAPRGKVLLDLDAFKIVVRNLVENAVKYSVGELELVINLYIKHDKLYLDFIDNGIGISPKDKKRIFNKFLRLESKNIPNVKGTGLGLYMVREIVKGHKGKIDVWSEGEGKGSTFQVIFPLFKERDKENVIKEKNIKELEK